MLVLDLIVAEYIDESIPIRWYMEDLKLSRIDQENCRKIAEVFELVIEKELQIFNGHSNLNRISCIRNELFKR